MSGNEFKRPDAAQCPSDKDQGDETANMVDGFISDYFNGRFDEDMEKLTPYQRLNMYLKCLGMRLPKFKAIDLHTSSDVTYTEIEECVGKFLRRSFNPSGDTPAGEGEEGAIGSP